MDGIRLGFLICYGTYFTEYIAHLAHCHPDIVLVSAFQRAERQDILRMLSQNLVFTCNSFVLRSSGSMGSDAEVGGTSLAVSPDGRILGDFGSRTGCFTCEIGDPDPVKKRYPYILKAESISVQNKAENIRFNRLALLSNGITILGA